MIKRRINRLLDTTHLDLVDIASILTQIVLEHGPNCDSLVVDPLKGEIVFHTIEIIERKKVSKK